MPASHMVHKVMSGLRRLSRSNAWILSGGETHCMSRRCSCKSAAISGPLTSSMRMSIACSFFHSSDAGAERSLGGTRRSPSQHFYCPRLLGLHACHWNGERQLTTLCCHCVELPLEHSEGPLHGVRQHHGLPCWEEAQPDEVVAEQRRPVREAHPQRVRDHLKGIETRAGEHTSYRLDRRAVMDVCVEGGEAIDKPQLVEHGPVDLVELVHMADEIRREKQFPGRLHHAEAGAEDRVSIREVVDPQVRDNQINGSVRESESS